MKAKILLLLIALAILFAGCTQQGEKIKVGAVLPFTGSSGITGESSRNGLDLALGEINSSGGINGKQLDILYEDSQTKTDVGLTAFNKLKDIDGIKIVFTSVSGVALAVSPVANANKIVQMDIVAAAPAYSSPNDFTFRTGVNSYFFAEKMSDLLTDRNVTKVALLFINTEYSAGYKQAFLDSYQGKGGKAVAVESFNQDDKDFKTQLGKIQNSSAQTLVLISLQKETPLLLRQMDETGFEMPIFTDVYAAELTDNLKTKSAEKIIYLKPKIDFENEKNSVAKSFKEKYLQKYGKEPDFVAAQAYDGLRLVVEAMKQCPNPENTECIKEALYKIKNFQGAIGNNLSFNSNGDIVDRPLETMTIKNGKFVLYPG